MKVTTKPETAEKKVVKTTKKEGVLKKVAKQLTPKKEEKVVAAEAPKAEPVVKHVTPMPLKPEFAKRPKPLMTMQRPKTICGNKISVCRLNARNVKMI